MEKIAPSSHPLATWCPLPDEKTLLRQVNQAKLRSFRTAPFENPIEIIGELQNKHNFKLKGTRPMTFCFGCDFYRNDDGVLSMQPRKYIEKIIET